MRISSPTLRTQTDLKDKEAALKAMLAKFEAVILEQAKSGTAVRPSERRAANEERDAAMGVIPQPGNGAFQDRRGGGDYGGGRDGGAGGYQNAARGGGFGSGGYNDAQGGQGFGEGYGNSAPPRRYEDGGQGAPRGCAKWLV